MRVLFLTHRLPWPPNKGDKIRSHHILRRLAQRHEVFLACLVDDAADLQFIDELKPYVRQVLYDRIDARRKPVAALGAILRNEPITVRHFYSARLARQIDALLDREEMDAFFCFSSPMAEYLFTSRHATGRISRAIRVMDLIDVDSYKWRQYADRSGILMSAAYRYEASRLAEYETRITNEFDRLFLVSEQEKRHMPAGSCQDRLRSMSNGVDLEYFSPAPCADAAEPTIVFTGVMDYWPNVHGVRWFTERVYPRIRAVVPGVKFLIVGSKPVREVLRLAAIPGIEVTGFVEDVRPYLRRANVCIVPLEIARGLQNKVLEAMAMGKAVVSTPDALEGIRAEIGRDVIVADDEGAFAERTIALLNNVSYAEQVGRNARRCVEEHYSWDANLAALEEILPAPQGRHLSPAQRQATR